MQYAFSLGITAQDFFSMTPWQFKQAIIGFEIKSKREFEHERWLTWHAVALPRMKKMLSLDEFIGRKKPVQGVDESAIMTRLKKYSQRYKQEVK